MEDYQIISLIIAGFVLLILIFKKIKNRRREKEWLVFEQEKGVNDNISKNRYAIHKKTGQRRELK